MLLAAAGVLGGYGGKSEFQARSPSRKVGSTQSEVPVLTGHNKFQAYRNPSRKVGSQSEVPVLTLKGGVVNVHGYQSYSIARSGKLTFVRKPRKFKAIEALLTTLHKEHGFESLLDVGCNAGLISLIARNAGFREVLGLDHDREYVDVFNRVATARNATSGLRASVFSFGSPMPTTADVVFCGAILHWVYCLTANFAKEGFGGILRYLLQYATEYLIVEWIDPSDAGVQGFDHIRKCGIKGLTQQYTVGNFERAIAQHATIESKQTLDGRSRVLYVMRPLAASARRRESSP